MTGLEVFLLGILLMVCALQAITYSRYKSIKKDFDVLFEKYKKSSRNDKRDPLTGRFTKSF